VTLDSTTQPTYAERRAAMADETRTRILDACVAILARGVAELSIPAVAREANVSVPTVYRNFADKKTLVRETAQYLREKRSPPVAPPRLDNLAEHLRLQFQQAASINETVRAALSSEPVMAARREQGEVERRRGHATALLDSHVHELSPRERERAIMVTSVLCSSAALRAFREIADTTPEEAAEAVAWTIGRLVGHDLLTPASPRKKPKGSKR
jgi:AcrR family transcriptional regulator